MVSAVRTSSPCSRSFCPFVRVGRVRKIHPPWLLSRALVMECLLHVKIVRTDLALSTAEFNTASSTRTQTPSQAKPSRPSPTKRERERRGEDEKYRMRERAGGKMRAGACPFSWNTPVVGLIAHRPAPIRSKAYTTQPRAPASWPSSTTPHPASQPCPPPPAARTQQQHSTAPAQPAASGTERERARQPR
jgi:hypothetical protein